MSLILRVRPIKSDPLQHEGGKVGYGRKFHKLIKQGNIPQDKSEKLSFTYQVFVAFEKPE